MPKLSNHELVDVTTTYFRSKHLQLTFPNEITPMLKPSNLYLLGKEHYERGALRLARAILADSRSQYLKTPNVLSSECELEYYNLARELISDSYLKDDSFTREDRCVRAIDVLLTENSPYDNLDRYCTLSSAGFLYALLGLLRRDTSLLRRSITFLDKADNSDDRNSYDKSCLYAAIVCLRCAKFERRKNGSAYIPSKSTLNEADIWFHRSIERSEGKLRELISPILAEWYPNSDHSSDSEYDSSDEIGDMLGQFITGLRDRENHPGEDSPELSLLDEKIRDEIWHNLSIVLAAYIGLCNYQASNQYIDFILDYHKITYTYDAEQLADPLRRLLVERFMKTITNTACQSQSFSSDG